MFKFKIGSPNSSCNSNLSATTRTYKENGITVCSDESSSLPKKSAHCVYKDHSIIRSFVFAVLMKYVECGKCLSRTVKCLDAFGSSGVNGLMWKKHFGDDVNVVINDNNKESYRVIKDHAEKNKVDVDVVSKDPCIILYECAFNFIFLDCKTEASFYLDAAFKNISRNGILVITTKDDPTLQVSTPDVAYRRYGGHVVRTCYLNELAIRVVIGAMTRAAAKYNKGLEVLCCVSFKNTFTIAIMVQKGPTNADKCLKNLCQLYHCGSCEDRALLPHLSGYNQNYNPRNILKSKCKNNSHSIIELGPLWGGEIFNQEFIHGMLNGKPSYDTNLTVILETILNEARCEGDVNNCNNQEENQPTMTPPFYYNLHKHHPKLSQLKSVEKVISELRKDGYKASRTHFDKLSVRTNAPVEQLYEILSS